VAVEREANPKVEIAHVLAMDIVEYSTLLIAEQTGVMGELPHSIAALAQARPGLNDQQAALQAIDRAIKLAPISKDARSNFFRRNTRTNSGREFAQILRRAEAAQRLQRCAYF
jgi:hypothetical protein